MTKWHCVGITAEQIAPMLANPVEVSSTVNVRMTYETLPEDQGNMMFHVKMSMPLVIANRSMITCLYKQTESDGSQTIVQSSQGNEAFATARAA